MIQWVHRHRTDISVMLIIAGVALTALAPIAHPGLYASNDGEIHVARLAQFTLAISDGHFPVRWLKNWFDGFGYPIFVFAYSLPYYLGALVRFVTSLSYASIFKVLMVVSFVGSGMTQFIYLRKLFRPFPAFVGSIFFLFAPYRFADMYFRGALGEALAFLFIPLLFLSLHWVKEKRHFSVLVMSMLVGALLLTHVIVFVLLLPFLLIYTWLLFHHDTRSYARAIYGLAFGLLISAFQWMPLVFERTYTVASETYASIYRGHFLSFPASIRSDSPIQIGLASIVVLGAVGVWLGRAYREQKRVAPLLIFFFVSAFVAAFLALEQSVFIWENVAFIQSIIFPWRFFIYSVFAISVLASTLIHVVRPAPFSLVLGSVLCLLIIIPARHFIFPKNFRVHQDAFYEQYQDPDRLEFYFLPRGVSKNLRRQTEDPLFFQAGEGEASLLEEKTGLLRGTFDIKEPATILFQTIYFPGWSFRVDGEEHAIFVIDGLIGTRIDAGRHAFALIFRETPLRQLANGLTASGIVLIAGWFLLMRVRGS